MVSNDFADVSTIHQSSQGPSLLPQRLILIIFWWPLCNGQYILCSAVYNPPDSYSDLLINLRFFALTRKPKVQKQERKKKLHASTDRWKWWYWLERKKICNNDFWSIWRNFRQRCGLDSILRSSHWEVHFCHKKNGRKKQWWNKVRFVKKHCWELVGHEENLK
jgi:hypothetical protein